MNALRSRVEKDNRVNNQNGGDFNFEKLPMFFMDLPQILDPHPSCS